MKKLFLGTTAMFLAGLLPLFSVETKLTNHKAYISYDIISAGVILYLYDEAGLKPNLYIMNDNGLGSLKITDTSRTIKTFAVFPDKTKIAYVESDDNNDYINVINTDGTGQQTILTTSLVIDKICISPNQQKIVFSAYDPANITDTAAGTLYITNIDGSNLSALGLGTGMRALASNLKIFNISGSTFTKDNLEESAYQNISFSPDSSKVAFLDYNGYINSVNTNGASLVKISTFSNVNYPLWTKSGKIMFTFDTSFGAFGNLCTINPDGSGFATVYSTISIMNFTPSPDESKIACFTNNNSVLFALLLGLPMDSSLVVISDTGTPLNSVYFGNGFISFVGGARPIKWLTNTKFIAGDRKDIYSFDTTYPILDNLTDNDRDAYNGLLEAKGGKILFTPNLSDIYSMAISGAGKTRLSPQEAGKTLSFASMLLSPDGTKIFYAIKDTLSPQPYKLYTGNSDGTGAPCLIEENASSAYLMALVMNGFPNYSWSPQGTKIFFQSKLDSKNYVCNPDGTNKVLVNQTGVEGSNYIFSPDDSSMIFNGFVSGQPGIVKTDFNSYSLVLSSTYPYDLLDWKGNRILMSKYSLPDQIYTMDSGGTNIKYIGYADSAALSPDGQKVAYIAFDNLNRENKGLYISNSDGSPGSVLITSFKDSIYRWSFDGNKIIYSEQVRTPKITKMFHANFDGTNKTAINSMNALPLVIPEKIIYVDSFLDICVNDLASSIISVNPPVLDFAEVSLGQSKALPLGITNNGAGAITGTISSDSAWISFDRASFSLDSLQSVDIQVTVDNSVLKEKSGEHAGTITINYPGGSVAVNVSVSATCVLVRPNPFRLSSPLAGESRGEGVVTFYGDGIVPGQTTINIYTLNGELIDVISQQTTVNGPQQAQKNYGLWTVDSGHPSITWTPSNLVPGIYIYTYESPREKGIGKLTVIK